jgi:phage baseplate assembly protein gpV
MFFPDTLKSWSIDGANADALVIQSIDGSVCVSLHSGKVKIEATDIEVVGNMSVTGTMTNNGVNIGSTHVHSGVDAGPSNTGGPL